MTLIEIMIVLVIVGSITALLANQFGGQLDKSKYQQARIQITELSKQLDLFYADCGFYPDDLAGLVEAPAECSEWGPTPYVKKVPRDPWGSEYIYDSDGGTFVIRSLAKDKREGGDALAKDISSEDI